MTTHAIEALLASGLPLSTIILAESTPKSAHDTGLPVVVQPIDLSPVDLFAARFGIETATIRRSDLARLAPALAARSPDVLVVACFPWKIPAPLRALPRLASLNVHPSLLPRHRGPEPLFWTFHEGDQTTGVTVHLVSDEVDRGPVLRQEAVPLEPGVGYRELEGHLATLGGRLAAQVIVELDEGTVTAAPQTGPSGVWARLPDRDDLTITTGWSAERVFRFVTGVGDLFGQITLLHPDGMRVEIVEAVAWQARGAAAGTTKAHQTGATEIEFVDGSVVFRLGRILPLAGGSPSHQ